VVIEIDKKSAKRVMQMLKKVYPSTFKTVKSHNTNSNQYAAFEIYPPGGMENMIQKDIRLKSRSFEVMKESVNEELRDDELNTLATNLAYTMPNHTKFDDKKGPTDAQIMKAMKKYFKDLYKYSTTPQKKQAIKIVKKVLSEGKLTEDFSQRRGNFRIYLRKEIKRAKKITVKSLKLVYTKIKKGIDKGRWEHNKSGNAVYSDEQVVKQLAGILEDDIKKSQTYNAEEVRNMVLFEGKLNESQKITDNDIEKMADIAKKHKMKLAKMATHRAVSGNWSYQKMYDELMDDHDGQSYVSNSDRKKFYKAVKKAFPKAKIKEGKLTENKKLVASVEKEMKDNEGRFETKFPTRDLRTIQNVYDDHKGKKGWTKELKKDYPSAYKVYQKLVKKYKLKAEAVDLKKHAKFGQTGVPFPQEEPNTFAFVDYKKWAYKHRNKYKKDVKNLIDKYGRHDNRLFKLATSWWVAYDKKTNKGAFSNIKNDSKFGRALIVMMRAVGLVFDKTQHYLGALQEETTMNEGKGKDLADKVMKIAAKDVKNLNGSELMEFRKWIAKAFDMKEGKLNEISAGAGLSDVIKGKTSAIEGIKMSKQLAKYIGVWIVRSPYGRKYGKQILKGRIHSLIGPANSFGIERYLDSATKKEWKALYAKHGPKRESTEVAKKIKESSAEWAKTLKKLAQQKKLDNITSKDKETLLKIVRMVKTANEAKLDKEKFTDPAQMKKKGIIKKGKKNIILGDKEEKNESQNPLKHPKNKY
jgi:hypothetical protein